MQAAIEAITRALLSALERRVPLDATALSFLLRRFRETDRDDLRAALEPALAEALDRHTCMQAIGERAAWLMLFADALSLSADDRLFAAARVLLESLREETTRPTDVESAAVSVDAVLRSCGPLDAPQAAVVAVDELERIVAGSYRPGEGLSAHVGDRFSARGRLADHLALSSALLTAFDLSGRLPYSMLAEELVQIARRLHWNEAAGCFRAGSDPVGRLHLNCRAARLFCRLALLHGDPGYRAAAVVCDDAAYRGDAALILRSQEASHEEFDAPDAEYGLALSDWLALTAMSSASHP
jgi:hypothetical protein